MFDFLEKKEDIKLYRNVKIGRNTYPYIIIHSSGFHLFMEKGDLKDDKEIFQIQTALNISRAKMHIYSAEGFYLAPWANEPVEVTDMEETVDKALNCGSRFLDERQENILTDKLGLVSKQHKIQMSSGENLVSHNGRWYKQSTEDSDEVFNKALKWGWLGWFQFHKGKKATGVFYFLTLGMFGVGYFMDTVAFVSGTARDIDGAYYSPPTEKKWIKLGISFLVGVALLFIYYFLILYLNKGISAIFSTVLS